MIPPNVDRSHVLSALREIDENPPPASRESLDYRLEFEGKSYPPKYVITVANRFANGIDLNHAAFAGGESETNPFLRKLGFDIVKVTDGPTAKEATARKERC